MEPEDELNSVKHTLYESFIDVFGENEDLKVLGKFTFLPEITDEFVSKNVEKKGFSPDKDEILILNNSCLSDARLPKLLSSFSAMLFCVKYVGKELDADKLDRTIIFYRGDNIPRFKRFFKKYGWMARL